MDRCALCPGTHRVVLGDGPTGALAFCIGEAPGREENASGIAFIGQAGMEYNELYLPLAGFTRPEVYTTNTVKCRPDQNRTPTAKEAQACALSFLPSELERVQPASILLMGATACSLVPELDLETQHGIPQLSSLFGWDGWIVPMYHPAAGLHSTTLMGPMLDDWASLKQWYKTGEWQWPIDLTPDRDYRLCKTPNQVSTYFEEYPAGEIIGADTESHGERDWSKQVSTHEGTGIMVLEEDPDVMKRLGDELYHPIAEGSEISFHNAEADLLQFETMIGGPVPYRDTMQEAYHMGLPQGLKVLGYRLCGVRMTSWAETVGGASRDAITAWMTQASMIAYDSMRTEELRFHKTTGRPLKPKVTKSLEEKKLDHFLVHTVKDTYDIWKRIEEYRDQWNSLFSVELGPMPILGIGNLPLKEAMEYGVLDADMALRVALGMKAQRERAWGHAGGIPEGDWDPIYTSETA